MAEAVSEWVLRWAPLVGRGPVLDLACGDGRHSRYFLGKGFAVHAVDRDPRSIEGARFLRADLENGGAWPLAGQRFGAIVVTNYLYRPLFPVIAQSLAADGVLIYETFMVGNEKLGRPSNPDFLLRKGELLGAFPHLEVIAFEQGLVERPKPAVIQRLCAIRGDSGRVRIEPHDYR